MKGKKSIKIEDHSSVYSVEKVLDKKVENGRTFYLIKWLNYSDEHNSWEPKKNLQICPELIEEYEEEHPGDNHSNGKKKKIVLASSLIVFIQNRKQQWKCFESKEEESPSIQRIRANRIRRNQGRSKTCDWACWRQRKPAKWIPIPYWVHERRRIDCFTQRSSFQMPAALNSILRRQFGVD